MKRISLLGVMATAAFAMASSAMPPPRKGSSRDYRPPRVPSTRDHSFDREVAEWNAEVDRRKAAKKAAKKARRPT